MSTSPLTFFAHVHQVEFLPCIHPPLHFMNVGVGTFLGTVAVVAMCALKAHVVLRSAR